jgi:hypothetical protein
MMKRQLRVTSRSAMFTRIGVLLCCVGLLIGVRHHGGTTDSMYSTTQPKCVRVALKHRQLFTRSGSTNSQQLHLLNTPPELKPLLPVRPKNDHQPLPTTHPAEGFKLQRAASNDSTPSQFHFQVLTATARRLNSCRKLPSHSW